MNRVKLSKEKRSIRWLYYWTKFLGINGISVLEKGDLETTRTGIAYNCLLSTIYCCIFYELTKIRKLMQTSGHEVPIAALTDYFGLLWQFFECIAAWIIFAFFQRRTIVIIKSFVRIEEISKRLGTSGSNVKCSEILSNLMIFNFLYFVSIVISIVAWSYMENFTLPIWILFYVPTLATFNVAILWISGLLVARRNFNLLNEKLGDLVTKRSGNRSPGSRGISSCESATLTQKIIVISQLHRELRSVIYHMENHVGLPVLLDIGNNCTYMAYMIYFGYDYVKSLETWNILSDIIFFISVSHFIVRPTVMLLLISHVCGSTSAEANHTGNIVHGILNGCELYEKRQEPLMQLSVLSLDLLKNQVNISVFGLLKLDHFFFYSMTVTSVSYAVIMLQFCH